MKKLILIVPLLAFLVSGALATTRYVAQTAGTFSGGTACNGQTAITPTTWNSTSESPGDITYICGTVTGTADGTLLTFSWSGSSGSPLQLIFDTGATLTAPYWGSSGAINTNGESYITINGGTSQQGVIEDTENGTGLTYEAYSILVVIPGGSGITVENLTLENTCQHTSVSDTTGCQTSGNTDALIYQYGCTKNVVITNNVMHDSYTTWFYQGCNNSSTPDTGNEFTYNTLSRNNWGLNVGSYYITGLQISNNDISCVVGAECNWDGNGDAFHHNGMMLDDQDTATGEQTGFLIFDNYIHDVNPCTGFWFFDPGTSGTMVDMWVFNNVAFTASGTQSNSGPSNAVITVGTDTGNPVYILNNTFQVSTANSSSTSGAGLSPYSSSTEENNIVTTSLSAITLNSGTTGLTSNYNDFYDIGSGGFTEEPSLFNLTLSQWQSETSYDQNSIGSNPIITGSAPYFSLGASSPAIGAGANLYSLCSTVSQLCTTAPQTFGVNSSCGTGCSARPSSGAWTIGAYNYVATTLPALSRKGMFARVLM